MKTGFRTMGISTNISHKKRLWIIRHLVSIGVSIEGIKNMNATDEEIKEALKND